MARAGPRLEDPESGPGLGARCGCNYGSAVLPEPRAFVLLQAMRSCPGLGRSGCWAAGADRDGGGGFTMAAWRSAAAPGAGLGVPQICPCVLLQTEKRVFLDFSSLQLTTLPGPLI